MTVISGTTSGYLFNSISELNKLRPVTYTKNTRGNHMGFRYRSWCPWTPQENNTKIMESWSDHQMRLMWCCRHCGDWMASRRDLKTIFIFKHYYFCQWISLVMTKHGDFPWSQLASNSKIWKGPPFQTSETSSNLRRIKCVHFCNKKISINLVNSQQFTAVHCLHSRACHICMHT